MHDDDLFPSPGHAASIAAEGSASLPGLNTTYKAAGFTDSEVSLLVLVMGKDGFRPGSTAYYAFQYVHISLGEFSFTANGQVFRFLFSDLQPKLVTVEGRNLLRIFHQMGSRRTPWIRQADRDLRPVGGGGDEPFISRIEVSDWMRLAEPSGRIDAEQAITA